MINWLKANKFILAMLLGCKVDSRMHGGRNNKGILKFKRGRPKLTIEACNTESFEGENLTHKWARLISQKRVFHLSSLFCVSYLTCTGSKSDFNLIK